MSIRVLIVDDDPLVRSALVMMLGAVPELTVVGEATDGDEAEAAVERTVPDVVLMDIRMPRMDGIAATELLRRRADPPEVIVLTTFHADESVLRALRAGARGYLLKDTPPADIVEAVRQVVGGQAALSPAVTGRLVDHLSRPSSAPADVGGADSERRTVACQALASLTDRERDVALAVGRGLSNAEISAELFLSLATVKAYVSRLLVKMHVDNRVQIALLVQDAERP